MNADKFLHDLIHGNNEEEDGITIVYGDSVVEVVTAARPKMKEGWLPSGNICELDKAQFLGIEVLKPEGRVFYLLMYKPLQEAKA